MASFAQRSIAPGGFPNWIGRWAFPAKLRCPRLAGYRYFHHTPSCGVIQPYLLADIGEGITECRVLQWFVKPGDKVSQFDAICEVQSDKASVEITSRYDGIIKTLHHEVDDMAIVGKPLLDIDVEDGEVDQSSSATERLPVQGTKASGLNLESDPPPMKEHRPGLEASTAESPPAKNSVQVLPAVRLMLRQHGIDVKDIRATGKGGRVLKEDVQRHLNSQATSQQPSAKAAYPTASDTTVSLTPIESQMFKLMANSLSIPHFGYTHSVDLTPLNAIRQRCNARRDVTSEMLGKPMPKLTLLPIIIKAISMAFQKHQKLNAHLNVDGDLRKPQLVLKESHDFGIAVDTAHGLLVPVVRSVQNRSIASIADEINRLSDLAKQGTLKPSDFTGATFTVSNIGSVGGNAVSPIIVPPMVGILGIGKVEDVATFMKDANGNEQIVKRQKAVFSWSADHRVLDGASVARCAESVSTILGEMDGVLFALM